MFALVIGNLYASFRRNTRAIGRFYVKITVVIVGMNISI